jgi:hypothetical protein
MKRRTLLFLGGVSWLAAMFSLAAATPYSIVFFLVFLILAMACLVLSDKVR